MDSKDSWAFEEGDEIVGGRTAVRLLGGGRRYEAYLAWDDDLYSLVVTKIVRPSLLPDSSALAGLAGEARALAALNHPAIVRSFDALLTGDRPHLVLEFLDGPRLSTLIRRHGVVTEQLLPLALEICSALHYMSTRGFVHLDVKPRNVIMSGPPRLIDLSVAVRFDEVRGITTPTGTRAYMSPEQCLPERFAAIGPASDVWGLGVTLYEALTRSLPFSRAESDGDDPTGRHYPQVDEDPRPLPDEVAPRLAEAVLACLEKRPENRPTALELAGTLEPWVAGLPRARLGLFRPGGRVRRSEFEIR
jgi:eukaryotic-like serine/threonine-protein kinase